MFMPFLEEENILFLHYVVRFILQIITDVKHRALYLPNSYYGLNKVVKGFSQKYPLKFHLFSFPYSNH